MPNEYNIKGALTFAEYLECHTILAAKPRLWVRGIVIVYGVGVLIYGLLFAPSKPDLMFTMIGAILVAYGFIISPIQFRYRVKRNWDRYPKIRKDFDMRFHGLKWRSWTIEAIPPIPLGTASSGFVSPSLFSSFIFPRCCHCAFRSGLLPTAIFLICEHCFHRQSKTKATANKVYSDRIRLTVGTF
jgi:hypothetical protein